MDEQQKQAHPLMDKANWNKPKTWIIPLEITFMVDDPSQYDEQMSKVVTNMINELRSIAHNFDKSGKQLIFKTLPPIKAAEQIEILKKGAELKDLSQFDLQAMINKALDDREKNESN